VIIYFSIIYFLLFGSELTSKSIKNAHLIPIANTQIALVRANFPVSVKIS
jgi:hypothetical protein